MRASIVEKSQMATKQRLTELRLPRDMVGQILDGLEVLADDWEFTSEVGLSRCPEEGDRHARECSGPTEAARIAADYREIIEAIREQIA